MLYQNHICTTISFSYIFWQSNNYNRKAPHNPTYLSILFHFVICNYTSYLLDITFCNILLCIMHSYHYLVIFLSILWSEERNLIAHYFALFATIEAIYQLTVGSSLCPHRSLCSRFPLLLISIYPAAVQLLERVRVIAFSYSNFGFTLDAIRNSRNSKITRYSLLIGSFEIGM